jgi:tetratricopeptide (TPR) repeat protein
MTGSWQRRPGFLVVLGISISSLWMDVSCPSALGDTNRQGVLVSGAWDANSANLLVDYFRKLLEDRNFEAFRDRVAAQYSEEMLCRILLNSPTVTARRAAVLSLGFAGRFERSNASLARALRDSDETVRKLTEDALWSVWFRAGTPENNQTLQEVLQLMGRGQLSRAETLVNRLITAAPHFAEAYNQRAIIHFRLGRFAESAQDCQHVLSRNPYHFGALGGLAQCQIQLNRPSEALKTLRHALKLQPYSDGLRENIKLLEAQIEPPGSH